MGFEKIAIKVIWRYQLENKLEAVTGGKRN